MSSMSLRGATCGALLPVSAFVTGFASCDGGGSSGGIDAGIGGMEAGIQAGMDATGVGSGGTDGALSAIGGPCRREDYPPQNNFVPPGVLFCLVGP
ncbi:MAG: hypothetical protein MJD61_21785, partial [Proteobacteria bacterium]|nr:hypothetical protein [Pseudomonadota bacterium]